MIQELQVGMLRNRFDPNALECDTSEEITPLKAIIGQERAVRALQFGLEIKSLGFNVFVAGLPGTGRTTAATRFLEELATGKPVPPDWVYVNNFRDPYRPRALRLPAGRANQFQASVRALVEDTRREVHTAFESDEYAAKRQEMGKKLQDQRSEVFKALNEKAQQESFYIQATPMGFATIPLKEGKPISEEEFMGLGSEAQEQIKRKQRELQEELSNAVRQVRVLEREAGKALRDMDHEVALFALTPLIGELKEEYNDCPEVVSHLDDVQADMLENLAQFREEGDGEGEQSVSPFPSAGGGEQPFRKYAVNVLVDNTELEGAPVVIELNPTYNNLFGRIEKEARFGALITDFTLIREGALHRANGGYLLMPTEEILRNLFSWDGLKRALRHEEIGIEEAGERLGYITTKSLRPEPIPLDTKIVLIGQPDLYYLLHAYDEDFKELFKVKADFDSTMDRTEEAITDYMSFVCTVCSTENLQHLNRSALAKIVEHGSRLADDQEKLSTRFGDLSDVIREANYYAVQEDSKLVTGEHVMKAIDERFYRSSLLPEKVREMIERGTIMIDLDGAKVGQVNGLAVLGLGDISFGKPSRITISIGIGSAGILDIEREIKLGGPIHSKGVMILSGYMAGQYAQDKPLSLSARIVFEQSYSGVDGDSASSTELYAILSALSGKPIKQSIAVTGSVNQRGEVQAIGGVNQKIEGFFEVCKAKGLSGEQGVLIPESNVKDLMLKEEVVGAVEEGKFHIWSVRTVDEGIEVLTGVPAGERKEDGAFEEGTIHYLVNERLLELSETLQKFGKDDEEEGEKSENENNTPSEEKPEE